MYKVEECPVCKIKIKNLGSHLVKMTDDAHMKYVQIIKENVDYLLLKTDLYMKEISDYMIINKNMYCWDAIIAERENEICPGRGYEIMGKRRTGNNNPVFKNNVREQISNTVAQLWSNGCYENRKNGMIGKCGENNPNFNAYTFLKNRYIDIYKFYHKEKYLLCNIDDCDKTEENNVINIHHIDEDTTNFLLTNLEAFCVFHHMDKHYASRKTPFISITKTMTFDSCHNLLNYNGKCSEIHGHTYKLEVTIRKRIDMKTSMVMDFGKLKDIIKQFVIEPLDHKYLNHEIPQFNPTAENMVFWIWEKLEKDALLKGLSKIKLWETPDSNATITQEDVFLSPLYVMSYFNEMSSFFNWNKDME